jgi:hypothetical protein
MALSKIDVANMVTGATPVANGGTGQTTFAAAGLDKRPNAKPIIVNGNMAVAQRSTSVTSQNAAGYKTVDRMYANIDSAGSYTVIQESLTSGNAYNNGFRKAFRLDCTTADASLAADNNLILFYFLEGQDLQMIKKGTSNAEKLTLSFWVKSNKTGTAQVNLVDDDNSRICGATYTISSANTWEQKVVNYAADTTGAFDNDNNKSLTIEWFLDSGSTYSGGAVPTAWEAKSNADRDQGNLDIAGSTDNDFAITGIQLEVGEYTSSTLPPFQHESYGDNLRRCQRYYYKLKNDSGSATGAYWGSGVIDSSTTLKSPIRFPKMRTVPSAFETTGTASDYRVWTSGNTSTVCSSVPTLDQITSFSGRLLFTVSSGLTAGQVGAYRSSTTDAYLAWSAEL